MQRTMVRVQNYFPPELLNALKTIAEKQEESLAEVIRKAARSFIAQKIKQAPEKSGASLLINSLNKIGFKAEKNLSGRVDQYLYR